MLAVSFLILAAILRIFKAFITNVRHIQPPPAWLHQKHLFLHSTRLMSDTEAESIS